MSGGSVNGHDRHPSLLLSLDEVGDQLRVSRTTVKQLIYGGDLRSLKVARCRRVAMADLERYVEQLREEAEGT